MFELSLIKKYLHPKWKQLSVSLISLISLIVVALVVWLILVFMSVTNGMEKKWTEKLIALSAPLQILPTQAYYESDYYQLDSISHLADYSYKSIEEKKAAGLVYDPLIDEQAPMGWIPTKGRDLVAEVYDSIHAVKKDKSLKASDFEVSLANARFRLLRSSHGANLGYEANEQSFLTQLSYLASFDSSNPRLQKIILPHTERDLTNLFALLGSSANNLQQEQPQRDLLLSKHTFQERLKAFLEFVQINTLKVGDKGYPLPHHLLPKKGQLKALLVSNQTLYIPKTTKELASLKKELLLKTPHVFDAVIDLESSQVYLEKKNKPLSAYRLMLPAHTHLEASLIEASIKDADCPSMLQFALKTTLQKIPLLAHIPFQNLEIGSAQWIDKLTEINYEQPLYTYFLQQDGHSKVILPTDPHIGDGVLLPKSFRDQGMLLGDRGYLAYQAQTTSSLQEMRLPVYVAGFYDPGLIPNGGKIILAPKKIISAINASIQVKDSLIGNGINVWFDTLADADKIKTSLQKSFQEKGIDAFWQIKTYKEYEFSKDFLEQISSDKMLFSLIAVIIILVACTNIISMLILLVQQKKKEIGMMQAMGASKKSIALIFGGCGMAIGLLSSLIGTLAAYLTMKNMPALMNLLSQLQGHQAFNPAFFGDALPSTLNYEALRFVLIATLSLSLLSGLVPALKAMRLNTSDVLRSEQ